MDPSYIEDAIRTPVEYGSGWYLRGDVSWTFGAKMDRSFTGVDDVTDTQSFEFNNNIAGRLGFGYQVNPWFRWEVTAEAMGDSNYSDTHARNFYGSRNVTFSAETDPGPPPTIEDLDDTVYFNSNGSVTGDLNGNFSQYVGSTSVSPIGGTEKIETSYSADLLMASAYVDLPVMGSITPYVGGGIGAARVQYNEKRIWNCLPEDNETCFDQVDDPSGVLGEDVEDYTAFNKSRTYLAFAWQASAGAAIRLSDRMSLDVGYSFTHIGAGDSLNFLGNTSSDKSGLSVHQVRAGLRYELW